MKSKSISAAVLGAVALLACDGSSQTPADPGTVAYSQVQQIFDTRCAGGACHVGVTDPKLLGAELDLSASQAGPCLIGAAASEDPLRLRVSPGSSATSYLLCKLDPKCTTVVGSYMPLGTQLTSAELEIVRAWIDQGAKGAATGTCNKVPSGGADTVAPMFAGAASATAAPNSVTLQWNAATDDTTPQSQIVYQIYQSATAGGESYAAPTYTTTPGATSYSVPKLALNTKYYFVVRARDQAGNVDANKVEVSATTPATADTQAPSFAGLTGATASGTTINLTWAAGSDNVTAASALTYLIFRATAAGGQTYGTPTYVTAPGATSYAAAGLAGNTTYYFVVRVQDGAGNTDTNTKEMSAKTAGISFSGQVQPILTASCQGPACHSGGSPAEGLSLASAAASYAALVNVASTECPTTKRVLPSQPTTSYLIYKLQGSGPAGCYTGSRMPKGQPLSAADINTITSWIASGAANN